MSIVNNDAMRDYIGETKKYGLEIIDNSSEICQTFSEKYNAEKYERIVLVASGTSYNACLTARHFIEKILKKPVYLSTSYDYAHYANIFIETDLMIAVSQEGESTNTIDALVKAREKGIDNFIVTEYLDNTCTRLADNKVTIACDREFFGPKTKGYNCTVLTLYMMALEAGASCGAITKAEYERYKEICRKTFENLDIIIDESEKFIKDNYEELVACERAFVVGCGPHVGTALEGALKCLETVRYFYFSFETEEFMHGPLASVKPDVYTFIVAPHDQGYERSHLIYQAMAEQNDHVFAIGNQGSLNSNHVLDASFIDDEYMSVFEYIVPLQLLAYYTFKGKGIDLNIRNYPRISKAVPTKAKELDRK